MLRINGPVVKSMESVLRLEGSLWCMGKICEMDFYRPNCSSHHSINSVKAGHAGDTVDLRRLK